MSDRSNEDAGSPRIRYLKYSKQAEAWLDRQREIHGYNRWQDAGRVVRLAIAEYLANQDGYSLWEPLVLPREQRKFALEGEQLDDGHGSGQ